MKMRSLSILGRGLFASYFIYSAWTSVTETTKDARVREEYISKMVGFLGFLAYSTEETKEQIAGIFVGVCVGLKANGALFFLFGSLYGVCHLILYILIATPFRYDFYRYKVEDPEFVVLLQGFLQNMAFLGALLFFTEMKNTIGRRQPKKNSPNPRQLKIRIIE